MGGGVDIERGERGGMGKRNEREIKIRKEYTYIDMTVGVVSRVHYLRKSKH